MRSSYFLYAVFFLLVGISGAPAQGTSPADTAAVNAIDADPAATTGPPDPSGDPQTRTKPTVPVSPPGAATTASTTYVFPTRREMNRYWIVNTIGAKGLTGATFTASWNQWVNDSPSEWSKDATGWGQRYGAALLDNGINTTSLVWISRATEQDPRYRRCDCTGFWPRTRHALDLAFMSYNRSGGLSFSPGKIIAPYTGPIVTRNTIYPDRFGFDDAATGGAYYLAGSVGWNMVREFIWNIW